MNDEGASKARDLKQRAADLARVVSEVHTQTVRTAVLARIL